MTEDRPGNEWAASDKPGTLFRPLSLNPEPFPGDDTEELICNKCGRVYTMREYRSYAWVAKSLLCIACSNQDMMRRFNIMVSQADDAVAKSLREYMDNRNGPTQD